MLLPHTSRFRRFPARRRRRVRRSSHGFRFDSLRDGLFFCRLRSFLACHLGVIQGDQRLRPIRVRIYCKVRVVRDEVGVGDKGHVLVIVMRRCRLHDDLRRNPRMRWLVDRVRLRAHRSRSNACSLLRKRLLHRRHLNVHRLTHLYELLRLLLLLWLLLELRMLLNVDSLRL